MEITIPELAIIVCIGLLSISTAINTQGPVRTTLSYALAVVILLIGGTIGFLGMNSIESPIQALDFTSRVQIEDFPEVPSVRQELPPKKLPPPSTKPQKSPQIEKNNEIRRHFLAEANKILRQAQAAASNLSNFDLSDPAGMTDAKYEQLMQKANSLYSRSSRLVSKTKRLQAQEESLANKTSLLKAVQTLQGSASSARKFFNANSTEEEERLGKSTNSLGQSALVRLSKLKQKLK
jgi:hypothetical protein